MASPERDPTTGVLLAHLPAPGRVVFVPVLRGCFAFWALFLLGWGIAIPLLADQDGVMAYVAGAVFLIPGLICLFHLFHRHSGLTLDQRGLRITTPWRTKFFPWGDIVRFWIAKGYKAPPTVCFELTPSPRRRFPRSQSGILDGKYARYQVDQLLVLLQRWHEFGLQMAREQPE